MMLGLERTIDKKTWKAHCLNAQQCGFETLGPAHTLNGLDDSGLVAWELSFQGMQQVLFVVDSVFLKADGVRADRRALKRWWSAAEPTGLARAGVIAAWLNLQRLVAFRRPELGHDWQGSLATFSKHFSFQVEEHHLNLRDQFLSAATTDEVRATNFEAARIMLSTGAPTYAMDEVRLFDGDAVIEIVGSISLTIAFDQGFENMLGLGDPIGRDQYRSLRVARESAAPTI